VYIHLGWCSSHANATTTCEQSRPKQEGKDQASDTYTSMHMEVRAPFGRFVWRGVKIDDVTIHPSRGSRINPTLKVCEHNRVAHASMVPNKGHLLEELAGMHNVRRIEKKQQREEMKSYRRQRLNVTKPNQAWHARHRTWLDSWYQLARWFKKKRVGNPKTLRMESDVAVMLARPLHVSKVDQSKEKGKTKQATLINDFHAHGSKSSLWPIRLAWS